MSILEELNEILSEILPIETGVFSDVAPEKYIALTPMGDDFALYGDDYPLIELSDVRISVFVKGNYLSITRQITNMLLSAGFTLTSRRFIEHENDTGYNHYNIDAQKFYKHE